MSAFIDMTDQRAGRFVVLARAANKGDRVYWLCLCRCGNQTTVMGKHLRNGDVKSCGCAKFGTANATRHGHAGRIKSPEWNAWQSMMNRCRKKPHYVSRGIVVCERWHSFERFLEDMGPMPGPHYTLDRLNDSKVYAPGAVRWATMQENQRNRTNNHLCEGFGPDL